MLSLMWMPAGFTFYWCCLSFSQLYLTLLTNNPAIRRYYGADNVKPVEKIVKAYIS